MVERTADRTGAEQRLADLEAHLVRARSHASEEIIQAREQAALAIAAAGQNMDATIERARADAVRQVGDAHEQIAKAHRLLGNTGQRSIGRRGAQAGRGDRRRVAPRSRDQRASSGQSLAIPIASPEIRTAARRIENALTVLHQLDYLVEVGMAHDVVAERPVDPDTVRNLARMAQLQLAGLTDEFSSNCPPDSLTTTPSRCRHPVCAGSGRRLPVTPFADRRPPSICRMKIGRQTRWPR